ncbi:DNA polymerase III subunit gamma/tau [Shewanella sp. YIC-542]|uniref:DNA polymerase III subunit gamma/tau n=1 Tax=Shewanella mytili TaxID=3377111 RepID=UPI00398E6E26
MSYQVLARKWRPASFEQMVGQSHVLHALTNALNQQRLHHAYLFTGTRGVGKTSLARLFAKGLNCEQGITATPCGKCSACQEIAQGRFVDLIEVDAASRTKVDDTRELLDNVQYRPTRGRFKVYLIDEVHMLSRSSFNALLKTLEEPPEHVKFLLATTDPQKLPVTVLSRCLQFNLKSLTQDEITRQLNHILTAEKLPFESPALTLLAKAANGSMRDALSLTDQAIAFGAGQIQLQQVQTMLGAIDERQVISLLQALVAADIEPLMLEAGRILAFGADANEVLRSLLELLHQVALTQFAPAASQLSLYATQIQEFAEQLSAEQVQLYYQLLLQGRKDLPFAPDPKSGLEMALLRCVAFRPETPPKRWGDVPSTKVPPTKVPSTNQVSPTKVQMTPVMAAQDHVVPSPVTAQAPDSQASAHHGAMPATAGESTVASEPAPIATEADALAAEQALILSQAQSMGHGYQAADARAAEPHYTSGDETSAGDDGPLADVGDVLTGDMFATTQTVSPGAKPAPAAGPQDDEPACPPSEADAPLFGDAMLDQVLATREQLLQDIDALTIDDEAPVAVLPEGKHPKRHADSGESLSGEGNSHHAGVPSDSQDLSKKNAETEEPLVDAGPLAVFDQAPADEGLSPDGSLVAPARDSDDASPSPMAATGNHLQKAPAEPEVEAMPDSDAIAATGEAMSPECHASDSEMVNATSAGALSSATLASPQGNAADLGWYKLVSSLPIRGRVRQLAAHCVCLSLNESCQLLLKPDQKHLAASAAVATLQQAVAEALQQPVQVEFSVGSDPSRETPQEIRQRFKQELLAHAAQKIQDDEHVRWLAEHMGATLEPDSVSYNPEQLAQKTALIADGTLPK